MAVIDPASGHSQRDNLEDIWLVLFRYKMISNDVFVSTAVIKAIMVSGKLIICDILLLTTFLQRSDMEGLLKKM